MAEIIKETIAITYEEIFNNWLKSFMLSISIYDILKRPYNINIKIINASEKNALINSNSVINLIPQIKHTIESVTSSV